VRKVFQVLVISFDCFLHFVIIHLKSILRFSSSWLCEWNIAFGPLHLFWDGMSRERKKKLSIIYFYTLIIVEDLIWIPSVNLLLFQSISNNSPSYCTQTFCCTHEDLSFTWMTPIMITTFLQRGYIVDKKFEEKDSAKKGTTLK